jgi:hypothetical protein
MARDRDDDLLLRRSGPLETLFQEAVRRAAQLGLSGFFATEEALRRAFNDSVPRDWVDYLNQQTGDVRTELIDRMAREFGEWLRTVDMTQIVGKLLAENEFELKISISGQPRAAERPPELSLLARRK